MLCFYNRRAMEIVSLIDGVSLELKPRKLRRFVGSLFTPGTNYRVRMTHLTRYLDDFLNLQKGREELLISDTHSNHGRFAPNCRVVKSLSCEENRVIQ